MITVLVGLLTIIGQFTDPLKSLHDKLADVPQPVLYIAGAVIALIGVDLIRRGLSRKSRLLQPEVLLIDPDTPEHLKGREDAVRSVKEMVSNNPLVFLEGESGSGKSTLVRSGLLPALTGDAPDST
ncbi:MAG: hypothetical protein OEU26_35665, partial [Candidatus Tectomicrobia bacterium]|nr:hypothetical protein [Candidatus Tectomicrobia bacterium]